MKILCVLIIVAASPLTLGSSTDYSKVFPYIISKMVEDPSNPCANAEKSIPAGFRQDPANSPILHCSSGVAYDSCNSSKEHKICTIPLKKEKSDD
jgi:hypothetical protein